MKSIKGILEKMYLDKTFFRFIMVGIINTLVGSAIMFGCYNILHLDFEVSSAANTFFASILSYFLNKYYTFKSKENVLGSALKFIINITVCHIFSYTLAKNIMYMLLFALPTQFKENIAMLVGMVLFTITNYFGQRLIVFDKKQK